MSSSRTLGLSLALLALTSIVYWPALHNGFMWDDDDHLTANPAMTVPGGLHKIWTSVTFSRYYPLTLTTFWVQRRLWGLNPLPYHAVNIVVHAANAALVFLLLRRLNIRGAWVAAAFWAVHPVNVESVAWITELKNTQSGLFFFTALLCFLRFERDEKRVWFAFALASFTTALLSKPSAVVLPFVLLLLAWWQRGRLRKADFVRAAPFFALSVAMSLLTVVEQRGQIERSTQDWSLTLTERLVVAGKALWFYAAKLLWPVNLAFVYPRWDINADSLASLLPLLGAVGMGAILCRYRRHLWVRAASFGIGYYAIALLPVLGFLDIYFFRYSFVADHFQYLASIGIIALVVAVVAGVVQGPPLRLAIAGAALISLGFLSRQHLSIFADEETLWRDSVTRNPRAVIAQNNLGLVLYGQLQYRRAIECFDRALQADPNLAEGHYNLGLVLSELGQHAKAAAQMRDALRVGPTFFKAENGLGFELLQLGQSEEAAAHFRRALEFNPDYADARINLGETLLSRGQPTEGEAQFRRVRQMFPTDFASHEDLGKVLFQQHRLDEAAAEFRAAARVKPDDPEPHKNLADVFTAQQRLPESRQERAVAASSAERLGETHYRIATALQSDDDPDGAIKHFRKSITFRPNAPEVYLALSKLLVEQNRFAEAVTVLRQGTKAVPDDPRLRDELARLLATFPDTGIRNDRKP